MIENITRTVGICKNLDTIKDLVKKVDAISNENRLKILLLIAKESNKPEELRRPTYVKALAHNLKKDYGISMSLPGITKNHLSRLLDAGLIKKEAGLHEDMPVKNYVLVPGALEALSMDINMLSNQIANIQDEISHLSYELPVIKVLGGKDDGKVFELKNDFIRIGRCGELDPDDPEYENDIMLSNSYESVSRVFKPHATLKHDGDNWVIEDKQSECGIYMNNSNQRLPNRTLKNRDKIKLALGKGGAELVFISEM